MSNTSNYIELPKQDLVIALLERDNEIEKQNLEIEKLHHLLIQAKKNLYGRSSEKLEVVNGQILFSFAEEPKEEPLAESQPEETEVIEVPCHTRKKRTKKEFPEDIERERIEYDLESISCPCCGNDMAVIGEEKSEELEFIPARFKILEHIKIKRACSSCKSGVYTAALPPEVKPLERRAAGAGLLAQIMVSKYCDHHPLFRQEQIFKRHGIILPRKLLCGWVAGAAELLMIIYEKLIEVVLSNNYVQADETTLKVQDHTIAGKLHTGYLWAVLAPPNLVYFHYAESRAGEVPKDMFKDFCGKVQTDAYAGYNPVFLPGKCKRIGCMAHVRRKFIEVERSSKRAGCQKILKLISQLYKIERAIKTLTPEERYQQRLKKSFILMRKLYETIRHEKKYALPESPYYKALRYAWEQSIPMLQVLRDGRYELDNNLIENQMRPVALGRKNYLFAGSHEGAKRAAVLYSLINSCKLNGIDPYHYLSDVLRRIHTPGVKIEELLPHTWQRPGGMGEE